MKSNAKKMTLALVAAACVGAAHAELVTDRVGSGAEWGLQAAPASFVASDGGAVSPVWPSYADQDGLLGYLNAAQASLGTVDGATQVVELAEDSLDLTLYRAAYSVGLTTASVTRDTDSNRVAAIGLSGGFVWTTPRIKNLGTGGSITFNDLRIDLDRQMVTVDVRGQSVPVGTEAPVDVNLNDMDLFTIGQIDSQGLSNASGATYSFSQLAFTDAGLQALSAALGVESSFAPALERLKQPGMVGGMSATLVYAAAVPEPSTWLMMGMGLVGLAACVRKQREV